MQDLERGVSIEVRANFFDATPIFMTMPADERELLTT